MDITSSACEAHFWMKNTIEKANRGSQKAQWAVAKVELLPGVNIQILLADHELIRWKNKDPPSQKKQKTTSTRVNFDFCSTRNRNVTPQLLILYSYWRCTINNSNDSREKWLITQRFLSASLWKKDWENIQGKALTLFFDTLCILQLSVLFQTSAISHFLMIFRNIGGSIFWVLWALFSVVSKEYSCLQQK